VHKELHEKKAQVQAMQQMAQKKEQQSLQVHKREIEELKAEIDLLHHLLDRVTILVEITRELHRSIHLDETFLAVLTGALKLVRSQTGILFILDESQSPPELFPEAAAGPYQTFFTNYSFKLGEGVPGWVAAHLQPVKIDNEAAVVNGEQLSSLVSYERSAMVVPLADGDRTLGVLYLGRPEPSSFKDEEVEDLIEFCKHASRSIANAADYHRAVTQGILDDVTGLYNQMYFSERLREEEKRSKRYRYSVTLMLLDIDRFTEYNNAFGHDRGNLLLKELGEILREHTRETDVAARLQNDEFGVLLVESDLNNAIMIGERIRMALEARYMARGKGRQVTVSLGIANMPKDTRDAAELYQYAESALLNAKRTGGNKSAWWGAAPPAA
jgi:diguanylate cyclase (GGDEF)-like protein